ncbi:ferritin-like domain-containing protein [Neorhizobium sp. NPDC001467]|uniref:ferritin-like domain-containing protein n=1 Tax=Neorhizobium sp. NPDC001467 TaxID=3390595 RepID=UPI003D049699
MTHVQDHFNIWLRDAFAAEGQSITMLTNQAKRIQNYPDLKARVEDHLAETQTQQERLRALLERTAGPPLIRTVAGRLSTAAQGISGMLAGDEVIKGAMSTYIFEQGEIASYQVLLAAADELGDTQAQDVLSAIMEQEVAMAAWLHDHLDVLTRIYLMRDERDLQAKR